MLLRYTIVIERSDHNYSAFAPDVPGCVATGQTVAETARNMAEALEFHLEGLVEDGDAIPLPTTQPDGVVDLVPGDVTTSVEVQAPGAWPAAVAR